MRLALALLFPALAWAQNAQIAGIVSDPGGAGIAAASITAVHAQTGVRRATLSNTQGIYAIASLRPGTYKIQVRKPGFQTVVRQEVALDISQRQRIDFELPLGDMRQVVTVYGDPSPAGSAEGGVGALVSRKLVENLPINGRGLLTLLDIAPGVLTVPVRSGDPGQFSVNGGRATSNYFTVDGVSANFGISNTAGDAMAAGALPSYSAIGSMHTVISLEALEDFRLVTSSSGAEYGRLSGGQVVIQSRGGANRWRGSAFLGARNEAFSANDWFLNSRRQAKPPLRWWEGGGTMGGPVRKDRSFFFVAVDRFTLRESASSVAFVPSLAARQSLPASVKPLADLYRLPNAAAFGPDVAQFLGPSQSRSDLTAVSTRWDHTFKPRVQAFVRYQHSPSALHSDQVSLPDGIAQNYALDQATAGLNLTHTPHAQQEVRFQFGKAGVIEIRRLNGAGATDLFSFLPASVARDATTVVFNIANLEPLQQGTLPPRSQRQWNFADALSVLSGNHLWKFGIDLRQIRDANAARSYAVASSANSLGSLAAGELASIAIGRQEPYGLRFTELSAFAQDTWKLGARWSFSAGLRWDWYGSPVAADGASWFALASGEPRLAPAGTPLWATKFANFAPRLGVSWRIDREGSWVARAGAGLYYDPGDAGLFAALRTPPFISTATVSFAPFGAIDPSKIVLPPAATGPPFATFSAFAPDFQPPHIWQANLTLEHSLASHSLLSTSWVATAGRGLVRREAGPVHSPDFTTLDLLTNYGGSDYQALQLGFRQRAFRGLEALAAYTWSHSLDNSSRDTEVMLPGGRAIDRGNSSFDVRHSMSLCFAYDPRRLRGWGIDGIVRARSGLPVEMTAGLGSGGIESAYRPDYVASQPLWIADPHAPGGRVLNSMAFVSPPPGRQGTLGRNGISGFGFAQSDAGLRRDLRLGDWGRAQLRVEAFNLTNHPNFGNPVGAAILPSFGRAPGLLNSYFGSGGLLGLGGFGPGAGLIRDLQIGGPRVLQLQVKFAF